MQMDGISGVKGWEWIFIMEGIVRLFSQTACDYVNIIS